MEIKSGDLLFYKVTPQSNWIAKLIASVQIWRKEGTEAVSYSHVSIVSHDLNWQLEAHWPKTRLSPIDWTDPRIEVWRVKDATACDIHGILSWCYCNLDKPYDIGQILLGLFMWNNAYSCTEFVVKPFLLADIDLAPNAGSFIAPNELITDKIERIR